MLKRHSPRVDIQRLRSQALGAIRYYIKENVLPGFGTSGNFNVDVPLLCNRSLLYYLDMPRVPSMVLRAEPLRRNLAHRIIGHEILLLLGLPVPEITYRDLRFRTRFRWGFYFMAEQRLLGTPFREHPDPQSKAARLGITFAHLHGNTMENTRNLASVRWPPRSNLILLRKKAKEWLARYRAADCPDPERVQPWLDRWPKDAWVPTPRLCMGDISPTNILIRGEEVYLVDLSSFKFSSALLEIVRMKRRILRNSDNAWEIFIEGYRRAAAPNLRQEIDRYLPLLEGLQRIRSAGKSSDPERRLYHCQYLFRILKSSA